MDAMLDLETLGTRPWSVILTLGAIKFSPWDDDVDQIEQDLIDIILTLPIDVRLLGVEYAEKDFTGMEEGYARKIELVFNDRDHSFSSSSLRRKVAAAEAFKVIKQ